MAVNAKYNVYNGSAWVQYYLETTAAQVLTNGSKQFVTANTKVNGQSFSLNSDGANASVTINGSHIVGNAVATVPSSSTTGLHYIDSSDNINAALGKLDAAAYAASQSVPAAYIKSASVSGNVLTLTKQDNSTVTFTDHNDNTTYSFAEGTTNGAFQVTPSGGSAQTVTIHGLGNAAYKNVATQYGGTDRTGLVTLSILDTAISSLPKAMQFIGSVGSGGTIEWSALPQASLVQGYTYKVITAHNTAPVCKVGDTIVSNGTEWVVIPSGDEPSGTVTSINLSNLNSSYAAENTIDISGGPITTSGTINIRLISGYGDKVNPYGSKTVHYVLAAPSNGNGAPSFRALNSGDIPDLSDDYLPRYPGSTTPIDTLYFGDSRTHIETIEQYNASAGRDYYSLKFVGELGMYAFTKGVASNSPVGTLNFVNLTASRSYTFPDDGGTIALQGWVTENTLKCVVAAGPNAPSGTFHSGDIWIEI